MKNVEGGTCAPKASDDHSAYTPHLFRSKKDQRNQLPAHKVLPGIRAENQEQNRSNAVDLIANPYAQEPRDHGSDRNKTAEKAKTKNAPKRQGKRNVYGDFEQEID
uniref:Uncharacterized protein n=1 Tax=Acrobeloides nanus TaxID=290746 RepID=A0A914CQE1_9BILA